MMKWTRYMLMLPVLMVQALSSCSLIDEPESDDNSPVEVSMAFSVSNPARAITRMSDNVVQEGGTSYRGLGQVWMIPFTISGDTVDTTSSESHLFNDAKLIDYTSAAGNYGGFYLYNVFTLFKGINAFLVYGRPPASSSPKAVNGSLLYSNLSYQDLDTLRLRLEPFYPKTTAPSEATLLAKYLTHIADANGWNTATNESLKLLYKLFTGQENDGSMVMAGASVNVKEHVNALYKQVCSFSFTGDNAEIQTQIINRIQNLPTSGLEGLTLTGNNETGSNWRLTDIKVNGKDYPDPVSLGFPDGAAALLWNNNRFVPQVMTTTLASINNISRFCYPAELFYYTNSRIDTSYDEDFRSLYGSGQSATNWDGSEGVLAKYENKNASVTSSTKGIAIKKPLQYAVGRLKINLQGVSSASLSDGAGKEISLTNNNNPSFPLTGVIICNQHPVGFDFHPIGVETHSDDCFIYDSQVGTSCHIRQSTGQSDPGTNIPSTLVLQNYDNEEVTIALEFRNDSGTDFRGNGGVIYPGTKFYLMGKIKPGENVSAGENVPNYVKKRVFTRDYVTTIKTNINSLAKAYNVLPNILGGRFELSVELTPAWIQAETTNVILE